MWQSVFCVSSSWCPLVGLWYMIVAFPGHPNLLFELMISLVIQSNKVTNLDSTNLLSDVARPRGYKTFFMLNSADHEIHPAHKW